MDRVTATSCRPRWPWRACGACRWWTAAAHLVDFGYVSDVARLMVQAAAAPAAAGNTYNATSGNPQPLRTLFDVHAELTGQPPPAIVPVPAGLCWALGPLLQVAVRLFAPGMSAMVTRDALAYLARDVSYDMSRAYDHFGFRPEIDFRAGLALVLDSGTLDPVGR